MTHDITQAALLSHFTCLGDACADSCCQNWSMQVDDATLSRYKSEAPELLAAVDFESDGIPVMKRDATTRQCIKLDGGWCGVHKEFGDKMLGDACHFYPRVTRKLGEETRMTATLSCPEIVRLMLTLEHPLADVSQEIERLPSTVKNYAVEGVDAKNVHHAFLAVAQDESIPPAQALARISSVARSMALLDKATWHQSVPLYLKLASSRLPKPEAYQTDSFNLLHALCGLIVASKKPISNRLQKTISDMEQSLGATLDWDNVLINLSPDSAGKLAAVREGFIEASAHYEHALRRYLQAQLSVSLFPFAGLGTSFEERITFIGVRYATLSLALACAHHVHGALVEDEIIRIIQSLSRFMDHLGEASFSLSIYQETGWLKEARLLSLL